MIFRTNYVVHESLAGAIQNKHVLKLWINTFYSKCIGFVIVSIVSLKLVETAIYDQ